MDAHKLLSLLKELNRIEYLLDTVEYNSSVPTALWQERRDAIQEKLEEVGFKLSSIDPVELGETSYSDLIVLYTIEERDGFPEEWEAL